MTSSRKPSVSVVIPVFNSEASLPLLFPRLKNVLDQCAERFEVIFVDDGSQDHSWNVIQVLAQQSPCIHPIGLMRNYGQHNALLCGIRAARHELIVTMDDDLQNPPEEIPKLLARLREGWDVVYGAPILEQHTAWRNIASIITKWTLQKAMGTDVVRKISAFRALRTNLREAFNHFSGPQPSMDVLLTWGTHRFTWVPVAHEPRSQGKSNYTFWMLMAHAANMTLGFSTWPLRVTALLGILLAGFGGLVLVYVVGRYVIHHGSVPGFPFLASIISVFSGAQLLSVGILGEYLARVYLRTMEKPPYIVREDVRSTKETTD